jgi:hypothetical protein
VRSRVCKEQIDTEGIEEDGAARDTASRCGRRVGPLGPAEQAAALCPQPHTAGHTRDKPATAAAAARHKDRIVRVARIRRA